jgi:hypothetical protein
MGKDNSEKLVFSAYYKRRFTLYIADTNKPVRRLPDLAPAATPSVQPVFTPYQPAIEVTVDPEKVSPKPSRKLSLEDASVTAGVNTDQTFVSDTVLIFGDNLGDRRLIFVLESISSFTTFQFSYYDISKRLQKGVTVFDARTYFLSEDTSTGQIVRDRRSQRSTGGMFLFNYPLSRYHRVETNVGYISRSIDYPYVQSNNDGTQGFLVVPRSDNFPTIGAAFIGTRRSPESGDPAPGGVLLLGLRAPDFSKDNIDPTTGSGPPRRHLRRDCGHPALPDHAEDAPRSALRRLSTGNFLSSTTGGSYAAATTTPRRSQLGRIR